MATSPRFTPGVNQDNTYRAVTQDYQSPAYASAIAITTTQQVTLVKVGTLTGALSLTINAGDGVDAPFVGDKVQLLFTADASGTHVVTFSTGFASSGTLSVAASTVATNIEAVLKNPIVDTLLSVITKGVSDAVLPKVEALLEKIITDLSDGGTIKADIDAAPDLESKLKVFISDLSKYNIVKQDMFLQKICSQLLAGLDNNNLSQSLYDLYSQAAYTLSHKAA